MRNPEDYHRLRRQYQPAQVRFVIVAESPPASGLFFYDSSGKVTEPLFAAIMKQLGRKPATKQAGLQALKEAGWLLVDATYIPVDKLPPKVREKTICNSYDTLRADLKALLPDKTTPIVLIKANVCRFLEQKLAAHGFNVINQGEVIPFPANGHQGEFSEHFGAVMRRADILAE